MKNVLLIGDSIRKVYDEAIRETLKNKANVYLTQDSGRFAAYLLRHIQEYKSVVGDQKVDVLHWNAGLWDCLRLFGEDPHTPLDVYVYYIERICIRIKKFFPEAIVIFATSTSVQSELMDPDFKRFNEEIEAYNAAAVQVVSKYGFLINDLYTVSANLPAEAHSDASHYYTPIGTEAFTMQVLSCILPILGIDEEVKYIEVLHKEKPFGI